MVDLAVPAGTLHDAWRSNKALRIVQDVSDDDFTAEAKFDSLPIAKYQGQGILVEHDDANWLRFDVYHDGGTLRAFAAATANGNSRTKLSTTIDANGPVWLRVARTGTSYTYAWSDNGTNWTPVGAFTADLTVTAVGPYAFNHTPSPAFTATVDYLIDPANPITPEDGNPDAEAP